MALGERIKLYREKKDFSKQELADKIHVSVQEIEDWENNKSKPDIDKFSDLAHAFGVSLDALYRGSRRRDKVHVGVDGITVDDKDGSHVHIGLDGINIKDIDDGDVVDIEVNDSRKEKIVKPLKVDTIAGFIFSITSLLIIAVYLLIGFLTKSWDFWWILFVAVAIPSKIYRCFAAKNGSHFPIASIVLFVYLLIGELYHIWSPTWVMFFVVPIYHTICGTVNKLQRSKKKVVIDIE